MSEDMLVEMPTERMWTLLDDRRAVRLHLPPLLLDGWPEPLRIHLDFDRGQVDDILQRLAALQSQMLSAPTSI